VIAFLQILVRLMSDLVGLVALSVSGRRSTEAEILFLRRQLALYQERRMIEYLRTTAERRTHVMVG
jgi:hypothetical protein